MLKNANPEYIITFREATRDENGQLVADTIGVDLVLQENHKGYLVFPNDLFKQAKEVFARARIDLANKVIELPIDDSEEARR